MAKVISKDSTPIAFEKAGQGPVVILVAAALSDRSDTKKLAALLAEHFTVINYDRRGRGESGDNLSYAVEREIEDIETLINEAGGSAFVFGSSSGAVLALEAANRLNGKIKKQVLYEPPLIVDDSQPPVSGNLRKQIAELISANRRNEAVKLFFSKAMSIPAIGVFMMRFMPGWSKMRDMAHTTTYDLAILEGTQEGKPLSPGRWASVQLPTLVLTGEKSEAFFHSGARALVGILPHARHKILKGQHHGSVVTAPEVLADEMLEFYRA
jgi:pimeloyl-ACP methyl ester carboxylesterase